MVEGWKVRYIPASIVDLCLMPSSWLGSRNLLADRWNWSLWLITFSMSLPMVLRSTIGLKALVVSYDTLLGFGIMIDIDSLKCSGQ